MNDTPTRKIKQRPRIRLGLVITILGLSAFVLGVNPGLFKLDRSPVVGVVQIAVVLIGRAVILMGGYITRNTLCNGREKSATGYVITVASGMADILGFGTQTFPAIPYFGIWQSIGVISGIMIIAVGFILLIPFEDNQQSEI